ncbi:MAG: S-layer family protein, partial [Leptolyngbya sp. SIO3F4]|nr:S-layer family protein [Leptolyngbya sp. SIO3F4]
PLGAMLALDTVAGGGPDGKDYLAVKGTILCRARTIGGYILFIRAGILLKKDLLWVVRHTVPQNQLKAALWKSLGALSICLWALPVFAQTVTSDGTVGTVVTGSGLFTVTGGTQQQTTLFHSFTEFSPDTVNVLFQLDSGQSSVDTVVGRVTGGNVSFIDSQLSLLGGNSPDLFLINPNGITFGNNASLAIPGSFLASTADTVLFADGLEFSTDLSPAPPLLTIGTPVGFQLGSNSGGINVNSGGHSLTKLGSTSNQLQAIAPHVQLGPTSGLQVAPGNTLALVGSGIEFTGGIITAAGGNLELSSVAPGEQVTLFPTPLGFTLDHSNVGSYQDINLQQQSLLNVSGVATPVAPLSPVNAFTTHSGQIRVFGRQINLTDASLLLNQNGVAAAQSSGDIQVQASQDINILGSDSVSYVRSGIFSETLGAANGGSVQVNAENMSIQGGGGIISTTYGAGESGQIEISTDSSLTISDFNPEESLLFSSIGGLSVSTGKGGDINISTRELLLDLGGNLTLSNSSSGPLGTINIDADEVTVSGQIPPNIGVVNSSISSSNFGVGEAGTLIIDTRLLTLQDAGVVSATSRTSGSAGDIIINATERIELSSRIPVTDPNRTAISSSVVLPIPLEQALFGIASIPSGNAGTVNITTPILEMTGSSRISVRNQGTGNAGSAIIQAAQVTLQDGAAINARTLEGAVGNIELDVTEFLLLRTGSSITVESPGISDGGDIRISVPVLIALENSDIAADAIQGNGGNIEITTQVLLGTAFRSQQTPNSDITASSKFGLNGIVEISDFEGEVDTGVAELSTKLEDADSQITQGCGTGDHEFVMTGRGGVPQGPTDSLMADNVWVDLRELNTFLEDTPHSEVTTVSSSIDVVLNEATRWHTNSTGQVELIALNSSGSPLQDSATCLTSSKKSIEIDG